MLCNLLGDPWARKAKFCTGLYNMDTVSSYRCSIHAKPDASFVDHSKHFTAETNIRRACEEGLVKRREMATLATSS